MVLVAYRFNLYGNKLLEDLLLGWLVILRILGGEWGEEHPINWKQSLWLGYQSNLREINFKAFDILTSKEFFLIPVTQDRGPKHQWIFGYMELVSSKFCVIDDAISNLEPLQVTPYHFGGFMA